MPVSPDMIVFLAVGETRMPGRRPILQTQSSQHYLPDKLMSCTGRQTSTGTQPLTRQGGVFHPAHAFAARQPENQHQYVPRAAAQVQGRLYSLPMQVKLQERVHIQQVPQAGVGRVSEHTSRAAQPDTSMCTSSGEVTTSWVSRRAPCRCRVCRLVCFSSRLPARPRERASCSVCRLGRAFSRSRIPASNGAGQHGRCQLACGRVPTHVPCWLCRVPHAQEACPPEQQDGAACTERSAGSKRLGTGPADMEASLYDGQGQRTMAD